MKALVLIALLCVAGSIPPARQAQFFAKPAASAPAAPAFVGEIQRNAFSSSTSSALNPSNTVAVGRTVVLAAITSVQAVVLASVSDDAGNTWTVHATANNNKGTGIASAYMSAGLTTSATITATWADATFSQKQIILIELSGCDSTQPDVAATNSGFAAPVSIAGDTTVPTVCIGLISSSSTSQTYGSSAWTVLGAAADVGSKRGYFAHITPAAGTQNPVGTWTAAGNQDNVWVGFK